jgi:hypothetical protein
LLIKVFVLMRKNLKNKKIYKIKQIKKNQIPNNNKKINSSSNLQKKRKKRKRNNKSNKNRNKRSNNSKVIKISNSLKHQVYRMILTKFLKTIEQMLNHR